MAAARWEYRLWQDAPLPLPAGDIEERTDVYILRRGMTARMIKLRDGRFDVKELTAQEDGLQRWRPAPRRPFPLATGPVAAALCLNEDERRLLGPCQTCPDTLVARLKRGAGTRVVPVRKLRARQEYRGCSRETAQVLIEGLWYGCQTLEHTDPGHVLAAIDALGWPHGRNESYVERLLREPGPGQPATTSSSQRRP